MASLSQINIRFNADLKQFSTQMQTASRKLDAVGKKFKRVGSGLSVGLTLPIVALGVKSAIAFDKQAKAIAQVEAGLKSTENAAGKTSKELQDLAASLQKNSLFGDEQILKDVTAQLLSFTNIAGTAFDRTQQATLDLAARLDGDLKSAAIQLGKALNDPAKNLSALSRSGIQFSDDQIKVIKALQETNRLAEAQAIILTELEKQYGGSAAAAAAAGLGPLKQLSNSLGDLLEDFGKIITEAITPFVNKIRKAVDGFKSLDDSTKKTIVVVGGLLAVLGPLLAILGVFVSTILPALAAGFTVLTGPIGLVVAGLAALVYVIYNNWDDILAYLKETREYFIGLYEDVELVRFSVDLLANALRIIFVVFKKTFGRLLEVIGIVIKNFFDQMKNVGTIFKALLQGDIESVVKSAYVGGAQITKSILDIKDVLSGKSEGGIKEDVEDLGDAIKKILPPLKEFKKEGDGAERVLRNISETISTLGSGFGLGLGQGVADGLNEQAAGLKNYISIFDTAKAKAQAIANIFSQEIGPAIMDAGASIFEGMGQILAGFATGTAGAADIANLLLSVMGDLMIRLGKIAIQTAIGLIAIKKAFESLNPAVALAAGVALIAFGSLIKSGIQNAPGQVALASGGVVFGETLSLIGDNRNAAFDPEVVAPLSKLKDFISPGAGDTNLKLDLDGVIRGRDIELIVSRVVDRKLRTG